MARFSHIWKKIYSIGMSTSYIATQVSSLAFTPIYNIVKKNNNSNNYVISEQKDKSKTRNLKDNRNTKNTTGDVINIPQDKVQDSIKNSNEKSQTNSLQTVKNKSTSKAPVLAAKNAKEKSLKQNILFNNTVEVEDKQPPTINQIYTGYSWNGKVYGYDIVKNGDRNITQYNNSLVIEFNDKDVIKRNAAGSSIYAGGGILANNLIKLARVDRNTGKEVQIDLTQQDIYGNTGIEFIDDSAPNGDGKDKIIVNSMSSFNLVNFMANSMYKLSVGSITDASGNVVSNPQTVNFTTGPAPMLTVNKNDSGVTNTGSSINEGQLITDIRTDGSYSGFVVDAGYSDEDDILKNVSQNTVKMYDYDSNTPLPQDDYTVNLSNDKKQITIKPTSNTLRKNKIYSVVISGVTDGEDTPIINKDNAISNQYRFYFKTVDTVAPSVNNVCIAQSYLGSVQDTKVIYDGEKNVQWDSNSLVIEFNNKDVIKENAAGSSVYAGVGNLPNDLIKLTRIDNVTGKEVLVDLTKYNAYGNKGIQLVDDTSAMGNGHDKIIINNNALSDGEDVCYFNLNSKYKLTIGNITNSSGDILSNPQEINFTTDPATILSLNSDKSNIKSTASSIDGGKLITDVNVDGSYSGFVVSGDYTYGRDEAELGGYTYANKGELRNVSQDTVKIYEKDSITPIERNSYEVSLTEDKKNILIKPTANALQKNKIYSVVINGVTDQAGNPIVNTDNGTNNQYRFYFETEDTVAPSISEIHEGWGGNGQLYGEDGVIKDGDKNVRIDDNNLVIEFNDKDVIRKNAAGSSIYAGIGNLSDDLVKLTRIDNKTGKEVTIDLSQQDRYGNRGIELIDDSDPKGNGKDKIIVNSMSGFNLVNFMGNSVYKLSVGNLTDASGNVVSNPQEVNFTTGPAPTLTINKDDSEVTNTGSSINAAQLITDIRTDGSYSGFVVDAGYSDESDGLKNVSQDTVKIYEYGSNTPLSQDDYTVNLSDDKKRITVKPTGDKLEKNKIYSVVINGVTDSVGNPINNTDNGTNNQYRFYFETADTAAPSISEIHEGWGGNGQLYGEDGVIKDGDKNVRIDDNNLVIEFNDKDVIRKNAAGSSIYAGIGNLSDDLVKLTRIDNKTGKEVTIDLSQQDRYGNRGIELIDDSDPKGNGKDKIIVNSMSGFNLVNFMGNSVYKLSVGNLTDASGNVVSNPQEINFTTGPAPTLTINKDDSGVTNTGSSINAAQLITDIRTDGSYSGFVVDAGYSDEDDILKNVSQDTVKVYEYGSNTPLSQDDYTVNLSDDKKRITVKPTGDKLEKDKIYSVVINGVTDSVGNPITNTDNGTNNQYRFYFQTGDTAAPSINKFYTFDNFQGSYINDQNELNNNEKNVHQNDNGIIIEFNDKDVIKKNAAGSSVYAGIGTLPNNLVKLTRIDKDTGREVTIDLLQQDRYGDKGVQLIDDSDSIGNGKDKIIVHSMSGFNLVNFMPNSVYKLSVGNITDASGNVVSNPQEVNFTTGPAPTLTINKDDSGITNTGSSIDARALITDIRTDGSYSGFVVDAGNSDEEDILKNVSQDTVKVYEYGSNTPLSQDDYTVNLSSDKKKVTVKPAANKLEKNKIYSVVINGVTDSVGNPINNTDNGTNNQYRFYFETADTVAPSISEIHEGWGGNGHLYGEDGVIKDGDKNVRIDDNNLVIEFNDKDVIKKNAAGSSIYAGIGTLPNDLVKLTRIDNKTGKEVTIDLSQQDRYGNRGIELIDDSDPKGNGKDKIIVNSMSGFNLVNFMGNSVYKLSVGNLTDASGNVVSNPQEINFTTGPAPTLTINKDDSGVTNTGSSINAAQLITDIRTDGSYSGFVVDAGYSDEDDILKNVSQDTVKVYEYGSNTPLSQDDYTVNLSSDKKKVTVKPAANKLEKDKIYSVVINGVTDSAGNPITNTDNGTNNQYRFYFQTGDTAAPSINKFYTFDNFQGSYINDQNELNNNEKNVHQNDNGIIIEFNDKDVIKKNAAGSSVYAGIGTLPNNLVKLTRIDKDTGREVTIDLLQQDRYGNKGVQLIDDSDSIGNGKDKIIVHSMSGFNLVNFMPNSVYKLSVGNITDASGNVVSNPQEVNFTTGPAPTLTINKDDSGVTNSGSSINAGQLITDIRTDGSYSGFVVDAGYSDKSDGLKNVSQDTVKIYEYGSNTPLPQSAYSVSESWNENKIIIKPTANSFQKGMIYSVVVNGVTDEEGNPIQNQDNGVNSQYRFYFQTEDTLAPSISKFYTASDYYRNLYSLTQVKDGDKNVSYNDNSIVIEFNDKDVIKKNAAGSSVYAGIGNLANDLVKLTRIDKDTGREVTIDLSQQDRYGNKGIEFIDDSDPNGNGKDKIIVNSMSGFNLANFMSNSVYKLSVGNVTDASGNIVSNPQTVNFTTGPAPKLTINKSDSGVNNTGSSIDAGALITDIKTDGSYGGFIVDAGYSDEEDGLSNVSQDTVKIYEYGSSTPISESAYSVSEPWNKKNIIIKPNANVLQKGKIYTVVIKGVTDVEGNPILNVDQNINNQYRFYFKTEQ
ncbi:MULTISPECIES: hypothetical protein [Clostridium]|uniref:hypothetical protein n=1 Tax=Clostridium TaxID=1485 RepID=UPI0008271729|nr:MULTISPECIES: hypothetical protein [Clostridium]PJI07550.1 hypothetical protein CUB90_06590 [Clostridium sp. CT7]